jgi:epoxyqueuosine reductase
MIYINRGRNKTMKKLTSKEIINAALGCGASLAGIANVEDLKKAPAFTVVPKLPKYNGVGTYMRGKEESYLDGVVWPEGIKSVVVLAYHHPVDDPKLDYWIEGNKTTTGNKALIEIGKKLKVIMAEAEIETYSFNYHIEKGGIFLKDSSVIAGLGCIGKNNLLVTPEYGSHVRLRAIGLSLDLPSTGHSGYDPCAACEIECWKKCSKKAFSKIIYLKEKLGRDELPGRIGNFDRVLCNIEMKENESIMESLQTPTIDNIDTRKFVKYCRVCEYSCPIGK